ncbi:hypothetical protein HY546_00035 [archaeon]|nr:hypothetical protein [archaeon]
MKTTVVLRDDIYKMLVNKFGPRGISKAINDVFTDLLFKKKKSLFGAHKGLKPFVREWDDRLD